MISIFKILKQLMVKYPTLDNLHLFSDSAAQHFKQRFFFNGVTMLPVALDKEDINFTITYDQFATSHRKGAVDDWYREGGGFEERRDGQSHEQANNCEDFAMTGAAACPGIQFIHVWKTEVEESMAELDNLAFSGAAVQGRR